MKRFFNILVGTASYLLAFGFWGLVFPEYTFTSDTVTITAEDGTELSDEEFRNYQSEHHIYYEIGTSAPDRVHVKSRLFEWIGEQIHDR